MSALTVDEVVAAVDENNKRPRSAASSTSIGNGDSEPTEPKVMKIVDLADNKNMAKPKDHSVKLEGLVSKLKSIRKPLAGTEDNSKSTRREDVSPSTQSHPIDNKLTDSLSSPPQIPTTVSDVAAKGDN